MKAGVIGLGHGSRVLINSFRLSQIEVYGVSSKNFIKAKKIGKDKKVSNIYKNWKLLVHDKNIDIIAIAVPAKFQIDIIKECIKKNKIIFCEKPLGINILSINKIIKNLSSYKKYILMNYFFQEHNAFIKFHNLLNKKKKYESDTVTVKFITQTYSNKKKLINWKSNYNEGGGIINLFFSHIIDYLIIFFGKVKKIETKIEKKNNMEERLFAIINFKSNIKAKVFIDINNPKNAHSIEYNSKHYKLILKNSGKDYGKKFKLIYKNDKKKIFKLLKYRNQTKKINYDSRIFFTSKIIDQLKKNFSKSTQNNNLKRFQYNENIINKARLSLKKDKGVLING